MKSLIFLSLTGYLFISICLFIDYGFIFSEIKILFLQGTRQTISENVSFKLRLCFYLHYLILIKMNKHQYSLSVLSVLVYHNYFQEVNETSFLEYPFNIYTYLVFSVYEVTYKSLQTLSSL